MRRAIFAFLALIGVSVVGTLGAGEVLSRPVLKAIGPPPADLPAQTLSLRLPNGDPVVGWTLPGRPGRGAVLLLHGVRANRRQMVSRARWLHGLGYAVTLVDLPAHGESTASRITYGLNEADGVRAALTHVRRTSPGERIAVVGASLGAASLVLARPDPAPDAVVLESMFPKIEDAVADRLAIHLGAWAKPLASALLWQLPWRLNVSPAQLRPIDALPALHAPVLIAAGSLDQHTTIDETRRLFAAANEPRSLWIVDGAAHVDLHAFAPDEYEARVGGFLERHLQAGPGLEMTVLSAPGTAGTQAPDDSAGRDHPPAR